MSDKKFDIEYIAELARLKLCDEEKERLNGHLIKIVEYVEQLNEIDTSDVEPTSHVLPLQNVFREDSPSGSLGEPESLLERAPKKDKGHYEVPQIIGWPCTKQI